MYQGNSDPQESIDQNFINQDQDANVPEFMDVVQDDSNPYYQPDTNSHPQYGYNQSFQPYNNAIPFIPQVFAPSFQKVQDRIPLPIETQNTITNVVTGEWIVPQNKSEKEKSNCRNCMMMIYSIVISFVLALLSIGCVVGALMFKLYPGLEGERDYFWIFVGFGGAAICLVFASFSGFVAAFFAFVRLYCLAITFSVFTIIFSFLAFLIVFIPMVAVFIIGCFLTCTILFAICGLPLVFIAIFGSIVWGGFTCPCICCSISNIKFYCSGLKERLNKSRGKVSLVSQENSVGTIPPNVQHI